MTRDWSTFRKWARELANDDAERNRHWLSPSPPARGCSSNAWSYDETPERDALSPSQTSVAHRSIEQYGTSPWHHHDSSSHSGVPRLYWRIRSDSRTLGGTAGAAVGVAVSFAASAPLAPSESLTVNAMTGAAFLPLNPTWNWPNAAASSGAVAVRSTPIAHGGGASPTPVQFPYDSALARAMTLVAVTCARAAAAAAARRRESAGDARRRARAIYQKGYEREREGGGTSRLCARARAEREGGGPLRARHAFEMRSGVRERAGVGYKPPLRARAPRA